MIPRDQESRPAPSAETAASPAAIPEPPPAADEERQEQPEQMPGKFSAGHPQHGNLLDPARTVDDRQAPSDRAPPAGGFASGRTPL